MTKLYTEYYGTLTNRIFHPWKPTLKSPLLSLPFPPPLSLVRSPPSSLYFTHKPPQTRLPSPESIVLRPMLSRKGGVQGLMSKAQGKGLPLPKFPHHYKHQHSRAVRVVNYVLDTDTEDIPLTMPHIHHSFTHGSAHQVRRWIEL